MTCLTPKQRLLHCCYKRLNQGTILKSTNGWGAMRGDDEMRDDGITMRRCGGGWCGPIFLKAPYVYSKGEVLAR